VEALTVKDLVKDGKKVRFAYYKGVTSELWYECENGFSFPVPLADTGTAIFKAEDSAMFFMRWIRKHLAMIAEEQAKIATEKQP
jgi:hypothetical protein